MIGQTISHYKILEKLGEGGMGVVYKAEDTKLKRTVALKFLPPLFSTDDEVKQRFMHEAQAASALNHTNICSIHTIEEYIEPAKETAGKQQFIDMEFVEGKTLGVLLKEKELSLKEVVDIALQIAEGLNAAHKKGIVHRDIKPDNIMVTDESIVKIMDFGLAKLKGSSKLTKTHSTLGTLSYMSPEQARGEEVDQCTDVFSLGAVLYEMITGRRPFKGEHEAAVMYSVMNETPDPLARYKSDVPDELQRVIDKSLAKERDKRYQHVDEMLAEMKSVSKKLEVVTAEQPKPHRRKGLTVVAGIVVLIGLLLGIRFLLFSPTESARMITSLAVLPLQNLSADPGQEYFSDGMTESIIKELSQIKALRVISRTSVMRYKNTEKLVPEIARELGVDAVVEGSVLRADKDVRITAQLIAADPERHLWAKDFTRSLENVLLLQSEVAQAIAVEIRIAVTPNERELITRARRVDPEAHEAYLKGEYFVNKAVPADVYKGIPYFQKAIASDSTYALAYAGVAKAYGYLLGLGVLSPREGYPKVRTYAEKALALDSTLAEGVGLIADVKYCYDWDLKGAAEYFRRALELNPNLADLHLDYGWFLAGQGRFDAGIAELRRARHLDPLSVVMTQQLAQIYALAGRYDSALAYAQRAAEIDSTFPLIAMTRCTVYLGQGAYAKAIEEAQKMILLGNVSRGFRDLAIAYALSGQTDKARDALAKLLKWMDDHYVPPVFVSRVYCALGDRERVFEYMEKGYEGRDEYLIQPAMMPPWCGFIKSDPRYKELMKKAGVEQ